MPTLHRIGAVSIRMYADDHNPPHFHVVGPDFQTLVRLSDLSILAGDGRRQSLASAIDWADANRDWLMRKWTELNQRG